jgi:hypothetical protein
MGEESACVQVLPAVAPPAPESAADEVSEDIFDIEGLPDEAAASEG